MAGNSAKGRDLPAGEVAYPDLPVRKPDLGYGIEAGDIERGYKNAEPEVPGDNRAGVPTWPAPKGFLYRGSYGQDR